MLRIIIPIYNEKDQLSQVFEQLERVMQDSKIEYEVIAVDDGSSDGSAEIIRDYAERMPVSLQQHPTNKGVSEAFRTGFRVVVERLQPEDLVVTMEANKNANPKLIPKMLTEHSNGADLVLASCYAPGGKVIGDPLLRLILSKGINFILRCLFPCCGVHTYTSFYRLWSPELLIKIRSLTEGNFFYQDGFVCMADMLIQTRRIKGTHIREIPFILISDIDESGSKMRVGKTILGYLKLISSNLFRQDKRIE